MAKTYTIREECREEWRERLSPEEYRRFTENGFDIDMVVELSRRWDRALQLVLNDTVVLRDEA